MEHPRDDPPKPPLERLGLFPLRDQERPQLRKPVDGERTAVAVLRRARLQTHRARLEPAGCRPVRLMKSDVLDARSSERSGPSLPEVMRESTLLDVNMGNELERLTPDPLESAQSTPLGINLGGGPELPLFPVVKYPRSTVYGSSASAIVFATSLRCPPLCYNPGRRCPTAPLCRKTAPGHDRVAEALPRYLLERYHRLHQSDGIPVSR